MCVESDWIVVSGGPGLSKTYLQEGFKGVFIDYRLHYYDQLGSPESGVNRVPTINELVGQVFSVAAEKKLGRFGLITHSFGNYIAMRALQVPNHNISSVIMISPMPFLFQHWQAALQKIVASVPADILEKIQELSKDKSNGSEIFKIIFPYYTGKHESLALDIPFDIQMCNSIAAQVSDYDDRGWLSSCGIPLVCITGDLDPFYIEDSLEDSVLLSGVGHYPFFESHLEFVDATNKAEKILCQKRKIALRK